MAAPVVLEVSSQIAQSLSSLAALSDRLLKVGDAGAQMGRKTGTGAASASTTLAGVARDAAKAGMAFIGIGSALQGIAAATALIRKEYESLKAFQAGAAAQSLSVGRAFEDLHFVLPKGADMTAEQIKTRLMKEAGHYDPAQALDITKTAISSVNDLPVSQAVGLAIKAMQGRQSLDAESIRNLVSTSMSLTSAYGGTPEQHLATIMAAEPQARTESVASFAKYVGGSAAQLSGMGLDERSAFSLLTAFGQRGVDTGGEVTGTTAVNFMAQVIEEVSRKHPGLRGMEAVEAFRNDKEIRKSVMGSFDPEYAADFAAARKGVGMNEADLAKNRIEGRGRMLIPIAEMMEPGKNKTKDYYDNAYKQIETGEAAVRSYDKKVQALRDSPSYMPTQLSSAFAEVKHRQFGQLGPALGGLLTQFHADLPGMGLSSAVEGRVRSTLEAVKSLEPEAALGRLHSLEEYVTREGSAMRRPKPLLHMGGDVPSPMMQPTTNEMYGGETLLLLGKKLDVLIEQGRRGVKVIDISPRYEQPLAAGQHAKRR